MPTFANTLNPTPFGFFNADAAFQTEADAMVTFVKRKLGDDILSVELTNKQIWMAFEESALEYSRIVNEYQTKSQLNNLLGADLGTSSDNQAYDESNNNELDGGPRGAENKFPRETLEFLMRKAEPYTAHAASGGSYNIYSGSIDLVNGQQDYNLYDTMMFTDPNDGVSKLAKAAFPKQKLSFYLNLLRIIFIKK